LYVERCMKEKMARSCFQKRCFGSTRREKASYGAKVNEFESSKVRLHIREVGCEGERLEIEHDLISQVNSASLEI